jgi:hypothetical protein
MASSSSGLKLSIRVKINAIYKYQASLREEKAFAGGMTDV